ncbi:MAG: hypothetical protein M3R53_05335 [Candidatus Eremiobacteraeota bacterium]|nr:hypothetical protein [Candidatus Eremiobacteraeota bacterium]
MTLADYPGFASLTGDLRTLLLRVEDGDQSARPALLERAADVLNVFVGLDLLQFVFMPAPDGGAAASIDVDLISAPQPEAASLAWFSVDEAGYDEFRDAVSLFGELTEVLNPPIVLDADDEMGS